MFSKPGCLFGKTLFMRQADFTTNLTIGAGLLLLTKYSLNFWYHPDITHYIFFSLWNCKSVIFFFAYLVFCLVRLLSRHKRIQLQISQFQQDSYKLSSKLLILSRYNSVYMYFIPFETAKVYFFFLQTWFSVW